MDIRTTGGPATVAETEAVDSVLGPAEPGDGRVVLAGHAARARRHLLLPVLHALQDRVGWISRGGLDYACRRLSVPPAEAYGVASFYALFATEERPPRAVHVCDDIVCGGALAAQMEARFGPAGATWHRSPCLGHCERAPAAYVHLAGAEPVEMTVAPATVERLTDDPEPVPEMAVGRPDHALLVRARELGPEAVIQAVTESGLVGRGGAAFPTGRKWAAVASAPAGPRYLVCNADESEPGTFKDRVLVERDPGALVEAIAIAAFATGCEHAYVYVRKEYPRVRTMLEAAVAAAGPDIGVEIEVCRGGGAYVCGEETALFNSIEGRRGEPRNKPPFPAQAGLFGRPTLVNNVETLLAARAILAGAADAAHRRHYCVTGAVARPGVYEAGPATSLRQLLERAGAEPSRLRAVLLGGAAGSFVSPAEFDVELSHEATRAIGATLGSGVVFALDGEADLEAILLRIARFFREESCGQCVPCRVGTVRQEELLHRLAARTGDRAAEADLLAQLGAAMRDASICGLGQTASTAVESAITRLGAFQ